MEVIWRPRREYEKEKDAVRGEQRESIYGFSHTIQFHVLDEMSVVVSRERA